MARKAFISSDMSVDERLLDVAEVNPLAAMMWPWFLTAFDDWGRAEAAPKRLKATVFPGNPLINDDEIIMAIRAYAEANLLIHYEVKGKYYIAIPPDKWFKYQTHIRSEKRENDGSRYPAPPQDNEPTPPDNRETARDGAHLRADARDCTPSPSPSPTDIAPTSDAAPQDCPEPTPITRQRKPDPLFETVMVELGLDPTGSGLTKPARGAINRAIADIRAVGGTPEQVPRVAALYRQEMHYARFSAPALAKYWPEGIARLERSPPNEDARAMYAWNSTNGPDP